MLQRMTCHCVLGVVSSHIYVDFILIYQAFETISLIFASNEEHNCEYVLLLR